MSSQESEGHQIPDRRIRDPGSPDPRSRIPGSGIWEPRIRDPGIPDPDFWLSKTDIRFVHINASWFWCPNLMSFQKSERHQIPDHRIRDPRIRDPGSSDLGFGILGSGIQGSRILTFECPKRMGATNGYLLTSFIDETGMRHENYLEYDNNSMIITVW